MAFPLYAGYSGITVTVPNDGASHSLLGLLQAVDSSVSYNCRYLVVQNDPASTASALIGGAPTDSQGNVSPSRLTSSNYGVKMIAGASETFEGFRNEDFNIARFYVQNGVGTVQLNVQIIRG